MVEFWLEFLTIGAVVLAMAGICAFESWSS
jgi:hypothetical protein